MAHFYRDQRVENVTIDEARIRHIAMAFEALRSQAAVGLTTEQAASEWFLSYIVRFDGKGYRLWDLVSVLTYFQQAVLVERLVFTLENRTSVSTNRQWGSFAELRVDAGNHDNCVIAVTDDNRGNVDAAFSAIDDSLKSAGNYHGVARGVPTLIALQLVGVVAAFAFSLWGAAWIAARLAVENAYPIAFLFVLLIVSNVWGFLHPWLLRHVNSLFPNIRFVQAGNDRWHWLLQTVVGTAVAGIVIALSLRALTFMADSLRPYIVSD